MDIGKAMVTGGASGIGAATARLLRERGARVVIADVQDDLGSKLASEIGADYLHLDVAEPAGWAGRLDGCDFVHLNAGVADEIADLAAISDEEYRRVMRVNADGVFFGLREAARAWSATGGSVVITASAAVVLPPAVNIVYTMTKHAVVGLMRSVAPTLIRSGVRVNAVCPGLVETPLTANILDTYRALEVPIARPADVAAVVVDVATSEASGECWLAIEGIEPAPFDFAPVEL